MNPIHVQTATRHSGRTHRQPHLPDPRRESHARPGPRGSLIICFVVMRIQRDYLRTPPSNEQEVLTAPGGKRREREISDGLGDHPFLKGVSR